ncbi:MAG: CaiB/BaiF CoA transferase family protein [Dehalococcoidia bacterium]
MEAPLKGIRVLDFGMAAVGPISAEYMGFLGADVIKIESPSGDIVRRGKGGAAGWAGHTFLGNNIGKRGIILDLKNDEDRQIALDLVKTADIVEENFRSPEILERLGLGWDVISKINPRVIYLQSSAFGPAGPMVGKPSNDWVTQAYGGLTSVTGEPGGKAEFSRGTSSLDWNGAMVNLEALLLALYVRNRTGKGLRINTSQFQSTLITATTRIAEYVATQVAPGPLGSARPNIVPDQAFPTADGWVSVSAVNNRLYQRLCAAIGREDLATDARFATPAARVEHRDALVNELTTVFGTKPSAAWVTALREARVPVGEFQQYDTLAESLLNHPQVQAQGLVTILEQTGGGDILSQQPHWKFDKTQASIQRPTPLFGEHQDEVMAELKAWQPQPAPAPIPHTGDLAMSGLKVVDFSQGVPGPLAGMQLGDLGADVIKVEPPEGDWMRQTPPFQGGEGAVYLQLNRNKRSIAVDLKTLEGLALAKRLVADADVVIEGYRPGVMARLGLDYETLSQDNPRLVYCSISGYGSTGPLADIPATELDIQVQVGATRHVGPVGKEPVRFGYDLSSAAAGMAGLQGILAALLYRDRTGQGQHVETSLLAAEIAVHQWAFTAERHAFDRTSKAYTGPRVPQDFGFMSKEGPVHVAGRGYDANWVPLIKALGRAELLEDPRFSTEKEFALHLHELTPLLNETLSTMTREEVRRLVEDEVGATFSLMLNVGEIAHDPQTQAVNAMPVLEGHPTAGPMQTVNVPWLFGERVADATRMPAPLLGQHTAAIAAEAGLDQATVAALTAQGTLVATTVPQGARA